MVYTLLPPEMETLCSFWTWLQVKGVWRIRLAEPHSPQAWVLALYFVFCLWRGGQGGSPGGVSLFLLLVPRWLVSGGD